MSMDLSEFYEVFFEECIEGLAVMESGLLNLDAGAADVEEINTIFRAAHSIKGGSATFDFKEIALFTHVMETLLDEMRSGTRVVTVPSVNLLLESVDCLREMIDATQAEKSVDSPRVAELQKKLEVMLAEDASASAGEDGEAATCGWAIEFSPGKQLPSSGEKQPDVFGALTQLGELKLVFDSSEATAGEKESVYQKWNATLTGEITKNELEDVFAWLGDDCKVTIKSLDDGKNQVDVGNAQEEGKAVAETAPEKNSEPTLTPTTPVEAKVSPDAAKKTPEKKAKQAKRKGSGAPERGSIRVGIDKIDDLINLVGELVITQSMLGRFGEEFDMSQLEELRDGLNQLERNSRELQETAMQIRMLPISSSFNRFPRLVRDLSGKLGKKVELKIVGENTELDKTVLEKIGDPLVHLVRNSLDHGLETPDIRRAAGKPETGILGLKAYHEGGSIVIEVTDDGAGLNRDRILKKAIDQGLVDPDSIPDDDEINNLIFKAGFSTAEVVSDVSGRGVGMDVVRRNINDLGGQVYVTSEVGKGSTLTIRLPLTLAIIDGQLVRVGEEYYVIPMLAIDESLQINPDMVNRYAGKADLYKLRDEYIPILSLHDVFGIPSAKGELEAGLMVVVQSDRRRVGLFVDELQGQQQVVIKSLEKNFRKTEGFSGATILGDGKVALILDAAGLVRRHLVLHGKPQVKTNRAEAVV